MSRNLDWCIIVFRYFIVFFISYSFYKFIFLSPRTGFCFVLPYILGLFDRCARNEIFVYTVLLLFNFDIDSGFEIFFQFFYYTLLPNVFSIYLIICKQNTNFWFWYVSNSFTYTQNVFQIDFDNEDFGTTI